MLTMRLRKLMFKRTVLQLILGIPVACFGLQAASLIVGNPPQLSTGNCDPFGCPAFFGLGTYQQVYEGSAFPGPIDIQALTFFDIQVQNSGQPAGGLFMLSLSYTSNSAGALDLMNPNNNIASDLQTFFLGNLPLLADIGGGGRQMMIEGTPFTYDPSVGNLLLTVTVTNGVDQPIAAYFDQANSMALTSNAYFGTYKGAPISGGNTIGGLVTQFSYMPAAPPSTIPEPASVLLTLAGAVLIGCRRFSLRRS